MLVTSGHAGEQPQWNIRRHIAQVVGAGTADADLLFRIWFVALRGDGDCLAAAEVIARE
jgi:hypothetical protein